MRTVRLALRHPGLTLALARRCCWSRCRRPTASSATASNSSPTSSPITARSSCMRAAISRSTRRTALVAEVEKRVLAVRRPQDRLYARRRAAARLERNHRGHHRRHPVRVRRLADAAAGAPVIMDAIRDKTADIPGILVEVTAPRAGPADRQADPGPARARSIPTVLPPAAKKVAADARAACPTSATSTTACRCPASTGRSRSTTAEAAKYGAGVEHRRHRRPARHQRREGHRIPPVRQRQGGRHPGALPARPAQPRPDRRTARADAGRLRADRQFRRRACRRRASATSTASTATA